METLSFQAPTQMKKQLEKLAQQLDRSKGYLIRQALEEYLADVHDYLEAKEYKASPRRGKNLSLAQMKRKYSLK